MTSSQEPRFAEKALLVDGTEYRYFDVSEVPGSEALPVSLKILLENVLRCARTPDEARVFASRIVEAGRDGRAGEEITLDIGMSDRLAREVASYGADAVALEPQSLRDDVLARLRAQAGQTDEVKA